MRCIRCTLSEWWGRLNPLSLRNQQLRAERVWRERRRP
jgi:hypothetical protein